jgi:hypothetical protein
MPFWFEVALAASGAFQWQYRRPWPTSAAEDSFVARADLCHQNSFSPVSLIPVIKNQKAWNLLPVSTTPPKKLFSGVVDTGDKFFGGVNNTGD